MQNWGGQTLSLSQHGQSSVPAMPFIIDAQSSMGAAAALSSPSTISAAVCDITTPIPLAPPAHAAAIGATRIAIDSNADKNLRNQDTGQDLRGKFSAQSPCRSIQNSVKGSKSAQPAPWYADRWSIAEGGYIHRSRSTARRRFRPVSFPWPGEPTGKAGPASRALENSDPRHAICLLPCGATTSSWVP